MDRGNDGLTLPVIYEMIQSLCPQLTRQQCARTFPQSIRPRYKSELAGIVIAPKSTRKRSAVTLAQQYCWRTVGGHIVLLSAVSTSKCNFVAGCRPATQNRGPQFTLWNAGGGERNLNVKG